MPDDAEDTNLRLELLDRRLILERGRQNLFHRHFVVLVRPTIHHPKPARPDLLKKLHVALVNLVLGVHAGPVRNHRQGNLVLHLRLEVQLAVELVRLGDVLVVFGRHADRALAVRRVVLADVLNLRDGDDGVFHGLGAVLEHRGPARVVVVVVLVIARVPRVAFVVAPDHLVLLGHGHRSHAHVFAERVRQRLRVRHIRVRNLRAAHPTLTSAFPIQKLPLAIGPREDQGPRGCLFLRAAHRLGLRLGLRLLLLLHPLCLIKLRLLEALPDLPLSALLLQPGLLLLQLVIIRRGKGGFSHGHDVGRGLVESDDVIRGEPRGEIRTGMREPDDLLHGVMNALKRLDKLHALLRLRHGIHEIAHALVRLGRLDHHAHRGGDLERLARVRAGQKLPRELRQRLHELLQPLQHLALAARQRVPPVLVHGVRARKVPGPRVGGLVVEAGLHAEVRREEGDLAAREAIRHVVPRGVRLDGLRGPRRLDPLEKLVVLQARLQHLLRALEHQQMQQRQHLVRDDGILGARPPEQRRVHRVDQRRRAQHLRQDLRGNVLRHRRGVDPRRRQNRVVERAPPAGGRRLRHGAVRDEADAAKEGRGAAHRVGRGVPEDAAGGGAAEIRVGDHLEEG
mmetsp:Transcript_5827/g.14191  ORF Transcript_5827/g.14191 Transcript_5827/m.14191 type:complete len:624 (+) Transcript_5827:1672-3543(+)